MEKLTKTVAGKFTKIVTLSLSIGLFSNLFMFNLTANAATSDDFRELLGEKRLTEKYSTEEKAKIESEYLKVEEHNRVAKMFTLSESLPTPKEDPKKKELESQESSLEKKFSDALVTGGSVYSVMEFKTSLDNLRYEITSLTKPENPDLKMDIKPNVWKAKYDDIMAINNKVSNLMDLGDIGEKLEPPVGTSMVITSPFGERTHPVDGKDSFHSGVDLRAAVGDQVRALWNGEVSDVFESESGGLTVVLKHDDGIETRYLHLSQALVKRGQKVSQYEVIALAGESGIVTGPHLHLSIYYNDVAVNPLLFFGMKGARALQVYSESRLNTDSTDYSAVIASIKANPSSTTTGVDPRLSGASGVTYREEEEIKPGEVKVTLQEGYSNPNPTDTMK